MRRIAAVQPGLAGLGSLAMAAAGACVLTAVILASLGVGNQPPAEAPGASQPNVASANAASRASRPAEPASQPRLLVYSNIVIFPLAHADAARVAQIAQQLLAGETAAIVCDERTNCVIVSGGALTIEKVKHLIAALDVPLVYKPVVRVASGPTTRPATQTATEPGTRPSTGPASRPWEGPADSRRHRTNSCREPCRSCPPCSPTSRCT